MTFNSAASASLQHERTKSVLLSEENIAKKKGERKRNYQTWEKDYLAQMYRDNIDLLESEDLKSDLNARKRRKWQEFSDLFNASFPDCVRTSEDLKLLIKNMKTEVRKLPHVKRQIPTGGGKSLPPLRTEWESILVELLREHPATNGLSNGLESGLLPEKLQSAINGTFLEDPSNAAADTNAAVATDYVPPTYEDESVSLQYSAMHTEFTTNDQNETDTDMMLIEKSVVERGNKLTSLATVPKSGQSSLQNGKSYSKFKAHRESFWETERSLADAQQKLVNAEQETNAKKVQKLELEQEVLLAQLQMLRTQTETLQAQKVLAEAEHENCVIRRQVLIQKLRKGN